MFWICGKNLWGESPSQSLLDTQCPKKFSKKNWAVYSLINSEAHHQSVTVLQCNNSWFFIKDILSSQRGDVGESCNEDNLPMLCGWISQLVGACPLVPSGHLRVVLMTMILMIFIRFILILMILMLIVIQKFMQMKWSVFMKRMSTGRQRTDSQVYAIHCHPLHCTCLACCLNCHLHYRKSERPTSRLARSDHLFAQHLTATDKQTHAWVSLIFQSATDC